MRSSRWKEAASWTLQLVLLTLILALTLRLFRGFDWSTLSDQIADADGGWLTLMTVAAVARYPIWSERWRLALQAAGIAAARRRSLGALWASAAVNTVTPTARVLGGLLRARHLTSDPGTQSFGHVYGTVLYDQLQHQVVPGLLSLLAATVVGWRRGFSELVLGGCLLLLIAGCGLAWWWGRSTQPGSWLERLVSRFAEGAVAQADGSRRAVLLERGRDAVVTLQRLLLDRSLAVRASLFGVVFVAVNAGAQWLAFRAIGAEVSYFLVMVVVALGAFAGVAAGTPGGIGAAEAAMVAAFVGLGIDRVDAAAATLLYRGIHYLATLSVGLGWLALLETRRRAASTDRADG